MNFRNALSGIAVKDIDAAIIWYEALIGRPPDIRPMDRVAAWQFPEGGWIEVFREEERAGMSTVILAVASLELQLAELAKTGIAVTYNTPSKDIGEVAIIEDPDGNRIVFAGPLTGVLDD
ncbi:VOC family protein [Luteolibacter yonseiensis]|uniref:VOC family protein n=1 Tax=Luteolibacter yonseiensis TaxID=1144680 RepID=A0A934R9R8_9BACT|nr:VOC family protein [Luteolibacter yonseiensis]MBK1817639.1 VOC family protein [Luteolibacter yonseiensis]